MAKRAYSYRVLAEVKFANGVGRKQARFEIILDQGITTRNGRKAAESAIFNYYNKTEWLIPWKVTVLEHEAFKARRGAEKVVLL